MKKKKTVSPPQPLGGATLDDLLAAGYDVDSNSAPCPFNPACWEGFRRVMQNMQQEQMVRDLVQ